MHFTDGLAFDKSEGHYVNNTYYKKLVSSTEFDYLYWEAKCLGEINYFCL